MFGSLSEYQHLHMFHLSLTASHLALSPDGSALALADRKRGHLEVYNLPGKLVAASDKEEGLTSNRDFGLVSGTVDCPGVSSVEYVSGRSVLTTSHHSPVVSLWTWQPAEDLIQLTGEVCRCDFQPSAVHAVGESEVVVWGEQRLARSDLTGLGQDRREMSEELLAVKTAGPVSWCVGRDGQLQSIDWRQSGPGLQLRLQQGQLSQSCILQRGPTTLVAGRCEDTLRLWDVRSSGSLQERSLQERSLQERSLTGVSGHLVAGSDHIVHTEGSLVSVYSLSLQTIFSHKAHRADISSLLTHSSVSNLIISADTANRLQAWVFNSNSLT